MGGRQRGHPADSVHCAPRHRERVAQHLRRKRETTEGRAHGVCGRAGMWVLGVGCVYVGVLSIALCLDHEQQERRGEGPTFLYLLLLALLYCRDADDDPSSVGKRAGGGQLHSGLCSDPPAAAPVRAKRGPNNLLNRRNQLRWHRAMYVQYACVADYELGLASSSGGVL